MNYQQSLVFKLYVRHQLPSKGSPWPIWSVSSKCQPTRNETHEMFHLLQDLEGSVDLPTDERFKNKAKQKMVKGLEKLLVILFGGKCCNHQLHGDQFPFDKKDHCYLNSEDQETHLLLYFSCGQLSCFWNKLFY